MPIRSAEFHRHYCGVNDRSKCGRRLPVRCTEGLSVVLTGPTGSYPLGHTENDLVSRWEMPSLRAQILSGFGMASTFFPRTPATFGIRGEC
jgi:hypothetical protein